LSGITTKQGLKTFYETILIEKLFTGEEWALVYTDHLSMIFIRRDSGNSSVINSYEKKKKEIGINTIID